MLPPFRRVVMAKSCTIVHYVKMHCFISQIYHLIPTRSQKATKDNLFCSVLSLFLGLILPVDVVYKSSWHCTYFTQHDNQKQAFKWHRITWQSDRDAYQINAPTLHVKRIFTIGGRKDSTVMSDYFIISDGSCACRLCNVMTCVDILQ